MSAPVNGAGGPANVPAAAVCANVIVVLSMATPASFSQASSAKVIVLAVSTRQIRQSAFFMGCHLLTKSLTTEGAEFRRGIRNTLCSSVSSVVMGLLYSCTHASVLVTMGGDCF